MQQRMTVK